MYIYKSWEKVKKVMKCHRDRVIIGISSQKRVILEVFVVVSMSFFLLLFFIRNKVKGYDGNVGNMLESSGMKYRLLGSELSP